VQGHKRQEDPGGEGGRPSRESGISFVIKQTRRVEMPTCHKDRQRIGPGMDSAWRVSLNETCQNRPVGPRVANYRSRKIGVRSPEFTI
jgi:hypothetical protein